MPGLVEESRQILRWLAHDISPDTFINILGQYHPGYEVGQSAKVSRPKGSIKYSEINRWPHRAELEQAYQTAREAGLWRFDER